MRDELRESFTQMAAGQLPDLRRFAYAVSGDRHRGDDLVQGALEQMYVAWPRVHKVADPGAYVRRILVRLAMRDARRAWWRREHPVAVLPERPAGDHEAVTVERLDLAEALAGLTAKQRAVLVLRFVEDRPVSEVAAILGIAEGTVKRQTHDAVARLRHQISRGLHDQRRVRTRGEQR